MNQIIAIILIILSSIVIGYFARKIKEKKVCDNCEVKLRAKALWFRIDGEWNQLILNSDFSVTLNGQDSDAIGNIIGFDRLLSKQDKIDIYNCTKGIKMLPKELQKDINFTFEDFAEFK